MRRSTAPGSGVDLREHPHPSPITPSIGWVGRGGWGALPILTRDGDCNIYLLRGSAFDVLIDSGGGASVVQFGMLSPGRIVALSRTSAAR